MMSEREIVAKARRTETLDISLLKTSMRDFPRAKLSIFNVAIAKVVVFIPPPVDNGAAPIHINSRTNIKLEKVNEPKSITENPAVLVVVAVKNAEIDFFINPSSSESVLLYSKIKIPRNPITVNIAVVISVILLFKLSIHGL